MKTSEPCSATTSVAASEPPGLCSDTVAGVTLPICKGLEKRSAKTLSKGTLSAPSDGTAPASCGVSPGSGKVHPLGRRDRIAGHAHAADDQDTAVGQYRRGVAYTRRGQRRQRRPRPGRRIENKHGARRARARLTADEQPPVTRQRRRRLTGEERTRPGRCFGVGHRRDEERHQRRPEESPKEHPASLPHGSVTLTSTPPGCHVPASARITCVPVLPSAQ